MARVAIRRDLPLFGMSTVFTFTLGHATRSWCQESALLRWGNYHVGSDLREEDIRPNRSRNRLAFGVEDKFVLVYHHAFLHFGGLIALKLANYYGNHC